jgi:hypothetical protein
LLTAQLYWIDSACPPLLEYWVGWYQLLFIPTLCFTYFAGIHLVQQCFKNFATVIEAPIQCRLYLRETHGGSLEYTFFSDRGEPLPKQDFTTPKTDLMAWEEFDRRAAGSWTWSNEPSHHVHVEYSVGERTFKKWFRVSLRTYTMENSLGLLVFSRIPSLAMEKERSKSRFRAHIPWLMILIAICLGVWAHLPLLKGQCQSSQTAKICFVMASLVSTILFWNISRSTIFFYRSLWDLGNAKEILIKDKPKTKAAAKKSKAAARGESLLAKSLLENEKKRHNILSIA